MPKPKHKPAAQSDRLPASGQQQALQATAPPQSQQAVAPQQVPPPSFGDAFTSAAPQSPGIDWGQAALMGLSGLGVGLLGGPMAGGALAAVLAGNEIGRRRRQQHDEAQAAQMAPMQNMVAGLLGGLGMGNQGPVMPQTSQNLPLAAPQAQQPPMMATPQSGAPAPSTGPPGYKMMTAEDLGPGAPGELPPGGNVPVGRTTARPPAGAVPDLSAPPTVAAPQGGPAPAMMPGPQAPPTMPAGAIADPARLHAVQSYGEVDLGKMMGGPSGVLRINPREVAESAAIRSVNQLVASGVPPTQALQQYQGLISPENQRVLGEVYAASIFQSELSRIAAAVPGLTREQIYETARQNTLVLTGGFGVAPDLRDPIFASQLSPETRAELELSGVQPELASPEQKRGAQAAAEQRATGRVGAESRSRESGRYNAELEEFIPPEQQGALVDPTTGQAPNRPIRKGELVGAPGFETGSVPPVVADSVAGAPNTLPIPISVGGQEIPFRARRKAPLTRTQESVVYAASAVAALEEAKEILDFLKAQDKNFSGLGVKSLQGLREKIPSKYRMVDPAIFALRARYDRLAEDYNFAVTHMQSGSQYGLKEFENLRALGPRLDVEEDVNVNNIDTAMRKLKGMAAAETALARQLGLEEPDFLDILAEVTAAREGSNAKP